MLIIDYIMRFLPEGFILALVPYCIKSNKISKKDYLIGALIIGVVNLLIKQINISSGFLMIISIVSVLLVYIFIGHHKATLSAISTLLAFALSILLEGLNFAFLQNFLNLDVQTTFETSSSLVRNLYGLPSLVIFATVFIIYYTFATKKENAK